MQIIKPQVTVVVPNYNCGRYIRETLESIKSNQKVSIEVIVVDDASTDDSRKILTEIAPRFQDLKTILLDRNHGGPSRPRNVGVESARGRYVCFVDADDLLFPHTIPEAVAFLEEYPEIGFVFYDAQKFDDRNGDHPSTFLAKYSRFRSISKDPAGRNRYLIPRKLAHETLFFENYVLTPGVTIRREVLDRIGSFDEELKNADDWDMWLRITKEYDIGFIDKIGFRYRVRGGSISFRGAQLAVNRIKVIRKHMNKAGISYAVRRQASRLIAGNLYGIGYQHQSTGDFVMARKLYIKSLGENVTWAATKGVIVTLLGKNIYSNLKKIKSESVIDGRD